MGSISLIDIDCQEENSIKLMTEFDILKQEEISQNEVNGKYTDKKKRSKYLVESYERLGMENKAEQVSNCGTFLEFRVYKDNTLKPKLHNANFCKDRLCPLCMWRRTKKIFGTVSTIMEHMDSKYRYLFLTLTIKNCKANDLEKTIDKLNYSFNKLTKNKQIKSMCKGYFKALEITYNQDTKEYHPHIHIIIVVNNSYFKSRYYIKQSEFTAIWKNCLNVEYTPVVNIEKIKSEDNSGLNFTSAVSECAKYTVKDEDYLSIKDLKERDNVVYTLYKALKGRRLCSYGGVMKDIKNQLKLEDEDGDLVHIETENINEELEYIIIRYRWFVGVGYLYTDK